MHCQTKAPLQLSWKVIGEIQKKKKFKKEKQKSSSLNIKIVERK